MASYKEVQELRNTMLGWVLVASALLVLITGVAIPLSVPESKSSPGEDSETMILIPVIISVLTSAFMIFLFVTMKLKVEISDRGISFSFPPFIREKFYPRSQIHHAWVRKYSALAEYGGWGYRGLGKRRRAFNITGRHGIQIITNDGRDFLVGIQNPELAESTLKSMGLGVPPEKDWSPPGLKGWFSRKDS